ncbi:hypothetical protein GYMLUDRAFT_243715 [Collybiopsis luxurians FD-317 M1]|uniref:Uncharacterized protein n=1 Tax=Collybiopsis luxurians FD-317 M1 TaxID=944289 RepID=A0A0D0BYX6_9AGAR|nr:hypothetical protein GYMLUDRAFT_243715 [Collybiopsis luxurians FD-317 M1]
MAYIPDTVITQVVMVDDTDPSILYSPSTAFSFDSNGTLDNAGWGGPVYNRTITGTTTNSSLSYKFHGTFVRGVLAAQGQSSDCGWTCSVDNRSIATFGNIPSQITNYFACDSADLLDNSKDEHVFSMSFFFNSAANNCSLWLDSIQYQPLESDPLDSVMLKVDNFDPSVIYGNTSGAWTGTPWDQSIHATRQTGTNANLIFNGTAATLYGVNWGGNPSGSPEYSANMAFYSVDGITNDFVLPGSANISTTGESATIYNLPLFTIDNLTESSHNLEVATDYNSSSNPQWLTIQFFIIKTNPANQSLNSTPAAPQSPSTPSSSTTSTPSHHTKSSVIIGGVLGSVVGFAVITILVVFIRKRQYRQRPQGAPNPEITPFINPGSSPLVTDQQRPRTETTSPISSSTSDWTSSRKNTTLRGFADRNAPAPVAQSETSDSPPQYTEDWLPGNNQG